MERELLGEDLGLVAQDGDIPMMPGAGAAQLYHRDNLRLGPSAAPATCAALVLAAVGLDPDAPVRVDGRWR